MATNVTELAKFNYYYYALSNNACKLYCNVSTQLSCQNNDYCGNQHTSVTRSLILVSSRTIGETGRSGSSG